MQTTRLSTKGQIILPKNIRVSRAWGPGTEFTVEETGDGILLRPTGRFPDAGLAEVAVCDPNANRRRPHRCGPLLAAN